MTVPWLVAEVALLPSWFESSFASSSPTPFTPTSITAPTPARNAVESAGELHTVFMRIAAFFTFLVFAAVFPLWHGYIPHAETRAVAARSMAAYPGAGSIPVSPSAGIADGTLTLRSSTSARSKQLRISKGEPIQALDQPALNLSSLMSESLRSSRAGSRMMRTSNPRLLPSSLQRISRPGATQGRFPSAPDRSIPPCPRGEEAGGHAV